MTLDVDNTKVVMAIPIDDQRAFVQELSGDTLAQDTYEMEGNKTKSAFFQFITFDSNASATQRWVEANPWLAETPSDDNNIPVQVASSACRKVFADRLYFMGRFELDPGHPEHRSPTSVVLRATDWFPEQQTPPSLTSLVVLKLMKDPVQFEREIEQRAVFKLEPGFVIPVVGSSHNFEQAEWTTNLQEKLPEFADYPYCIVMPAAGRNLAVVGLQERAGLLTICTMFHELFCCCEHLHVMGLLHCDVKVGNREAMDPGHSPDPRCRPGLPRTSSTTSAQPHHHPRTTHTAPKLGSLERRHVAFDRL